MWIKSNNFAANPGEDFVLGSCPLQAEIPLDILKEIAITFPEKKFSAIMISVEDEAVVKNILPCLIKALDNAGILVVAIGTKTPNDNIAQVILDTVMADTSIVIPPLMVRYTRIAQPGVYGYAFRFKRVVKETPSEKPAPTKKKPLPRKTKE